jgi:hypothetical protein
MLVEPNKSLSPEVLLILNWTLPACCLEMVRKGVMENSKRRRQLHSNNMATNDIICLVTMARSRLAPRRHLPIVWSVGSYCIHKFSRKVHVAKSTRYCKYRQYWIVYNIACKIAPEDGLPHSGDFDNNVAGHKRCMKI